MRIDQQWHGYRRGHQLLGSTTDLDPRDQDLVDKLSDASGSPRPGQQFEPYITAYPLPSGTRYVVSRTWQDLEAPRTGTVFTRSLLIGLEDWRSLSSVRGLFEALSDRSISREPLMLPQRAGNWPPVQDPKLAELVEALFLEKSSAVVGYDFRQPEVIAGRLLDALWPSRRAAIAICTYAVAPRFLADRSFDLVFAPTAAKSRFGKWNGRRIGAGPSSAAPRHFWTGQLVDRIFHDPTPNLRELDEIGVMDKGSSIDGSALRLSLLWSDLKRDAATSPRSLLGMLDVLSSVGRSPWQLPYFAPLVSDSIEDALRGSKREAWEFLLLLVHKLGSGMPLGVVRAIHAAASWLAQQDPAILADEIVSMNDPQAVPILLRPAVARGLSRVATNELLSFLKEAGPTISLALMAEWPALACKVTSTLSHSPGSKFAATLAELVGQDRRALRRIASGVSKGAEAANVAPLLKAVLVGSPKGNFDVLAGNVIANDGLTIPQFRNALVEAARSDVIRKKLMVLALTAPSEAAADLMLVDLIDSAADVKWLIEALNSQPNRRSKLLLQLIGQWSDQKLQNIVSDLRSRDALLEAVISSGKQGVRPFARLLVSSSLSPPSAAAILRCAFPSLPPSDRAIIAAAVLDELLSLNPRSIGDLLEPIFNSVDPVKVIQAATSPKLDTKQIGLNIAAIATSGAKVIGRYANHIGLVAEALMARKGGYGREGYDGWAILMREARKAAPQTLVRYADAALDYGLDRPREPCGALVSSAFPTVHARLAKKNPPPDGITAMIMASLSLFTDWDKAKSARHFIVEAFMDSTWEAAELLRAGIEARVAPKVLGYLVSRPGGRDYLRKVESSAKGYPEPVKGALIKALKDFSAKR